MFLQSIVRLQREPQIAIYEEEDDVGQDHAQPRVSHVEHIEDYVETVTLVSVEEYFKLLSSEVRCTRHPNRYSDKHC